MTHFEIRDEIYFKITIIIGINWQERGEKGYDIIQRNNLPLSIFRKFVDFS